MGRSSCSCRQVEYPSPHSYTPLGLSSAGLLSSPTHTLVQDDQHPPEDGLWIQQMLRLFEKYPLVGAIGTMAYR